MQVRREGQGFFGIKKCVRSSIWSGIIFRAPMVIDFLAVSSRPECCEEESNINGAEKMISNTISPGDDIRTKTMSVFAFLPT